MVLTEVLQNALEHAFVPGDQGSVEVGAVRGGSRTEPRLLVTVQDNGRGLPDGFDPHRAGTSGCKSYAPWWRASWAESSTWCPEPNGALR